MSQGVAGTIYGMLFHALCASNSRSGGGGGRDNAGMAVAVGAVGGGVRGVWCFKPWSGVKFVAVISFGLASGVVARSI